MEYRLQGIVQVQVHEKAGLTFAGALRSILRQDPDVVLVGEIRDRETAQIAIQASLTGHLVLSTLHTNDAANAVTRLVDIGIEPYKIAAALRGVIAQRLMRRLCPTCREVAHGSPAGTGEGVGAGGDAAPQGGRLCRLRHDRVPRPLLDRRGAHRHARRRAGHRLRRDRRHDRGGGARRRDARPVGERARARAAAASRRSRSCCGSWTSPPAPPGAAARARRVRARRRRRRRARRSRTRTTTRASSCSPSSSPAAADARPGGRSSSWTTRTRCAA